MRMRERIGYDIDIVKENDNESNIDNVDQDKTNSNNFDNIMTTILMPIKNIREVSSLTTLCQ